MQASTTWGSARREVRVWRASLASLKERAAVLLEPTMAACILRFLIISWRHVTMSNAMYMAQAARRATPLVSMAMSVSLRLIERWAKNRMVGTACLRGGYRLE